MEEPKRTHDVEAAFPGRCRRRGPGRRAARRLRRRRRDRGRHDDHRSGRGGHHRRRDHHDRGAPRRPTAGAMSDIPRAKIGFVTPRSGPLAALGETDDFVLAQMRELLGDRIEIIDKDTETDATRAGEVTNELIAEGAQPGALRGHARHHHPGGRGLRSGRDARACRRWPPGSRTTSNVKGGPSGPRAGVGVEPPLLLGRRGPHRGVPGPVVPSGRRADHRRALGRRSRRPWPSETR